ncbi:MAG: hypothetical protein ABI647_04530 [Gemmatimonadota bacterium]
MPSILAAGIGGDRERWADPLCEGPIHPWTADLDRRRERGVYLAHRYFYAYGEVFLNLGIQDHVVDDAGIYQETVLWLEHDLFDQMILVFLLNRLAPLVKEQKVSLISIDRYPGVERFIGLGQLGPDQLRDLFPTRVVVERDQVAVAARTWKALASPTPKALSGLFKTDLTPLPFLAAALRRYLAEYPSVENGLGRTERMALEAIRDGAGTPAEAFVAVQQREENPYQGDAMFYAIVRDLARGSFPLITSSLPRFASLRDDRLAGAPISLTSTASEVLSGREDWFRIYGVSKWIGGVHFMGPAPTWRWDEGAGKVVDRSRA